MACKTWSQPDGNHLRGLCTNTLFSEAGTANCVLCVQPTRQVRPCTGVCSPPLNAPQRFILDIGVQLTLSEYPYPYVWTGTLPPDHVGFNTPVTYTFYDKMPTAEQIAAPCILTATLYGASHSCEWLGNMLTTRWYRLTYDPPNNVYYSGQIYDPPEYGQRTPHGFTTCYPPDAAGFPYPRYECTMQLWGHQWHLVASTDGTATLELRRDVARHHTVLLSDGSTSHIRPLSSNQGAGSKHIIFDTDAPAVWNVMPNKGWFSFPNTVPQTIGGAPNYAPSLAMFNYYKPMAKWLCSDICESRTEWLFEKTEDLSETTSTPGLTDDGRPMPVILGLPKNLVLNVAE